MSDPDTDCTDDDATPRWVKVFAAIALVVVLVFVVALVFGGGAHGPGRHWPSSGAPAQSSQP